MYNSTKKEENEGTSERRELVSRDQFLPIWGFMLTDLNLKNTELLVYAVIFSIYRTHCDYFVGSRHYLQKWTGSGKTAVQDALNSLEKKGLIKKEYKYYGAWRKAVYIVNVEALPKCPMFDLEQIYIKNEYKIAKEKEDSAL